MSTRIGSGKRIPSLDGIRAVAIMMVLVDHFGIGSGRGDRLDLGALGVRIFFILSGYLITGMLCKELETKGKIDLPRFYLRRTLRISPPFYFFLLVMLVLGLAGQSHVTAGSIVPPSLYITNYFNIPRDAPAWWTFAHTWSLSTEEQFYLIWPIVIFIAGRSKAYLVLISIIIVTALARLYLWELGSHYPDLSAKALHLNADHLATGSLLAVSLPSLRSSTAYMGAIRSKWIVALPIAILALNTPSRLIGFRNTALFTTLNICIAIAIDAAVVNELSWGGRVLNWKPLAWIGTLSYSLYLWQQPFTGLGQEWATFRPSGISELSNPIVALVLILACATASYFLIERPFLRIRDEFCKKTICRAFSLPRKPMIRKRD